MPHSNRKVEVCLSVEMREELAGLARRETTPALKVRHARILLMADQDRREGRHPDWYIAERAGVSERQVARVRQRFAQGGLPLALERKRRATPGTTPVFDGAAEARLVALCCSDPPAGRQRWTLQLLVDELCRLRVVTSVCRETVRRCLKKLASSPGGQNASVFRSVIARDLSRTWSASSTSTAKNSTSNTRSSAWTRRRSRS